MLTEAAVAENELDSIIRKYSVYSDCSKIITRVCLIRPLL